MTVYRLLADIMEALKVNHVEHEAMRREMAGLATRKDLDALRGDVAGLKTDVAGIETKVAGIETDLAGLGQTVRKLGLDFEVFRQDSKIALDALSELMNRTSRHDRTLESHDLRLRVVENRLDIRLLAEIPGDR